MECARASPQKITKRGKRKIMRQSGPFFEAKGQENLSKLLLIISQNHVAKYHYFLTLPLFSDLWVFFFFFPSCVDPSNDMVGFVVVQTNYFLCLKYKLINLVRYKCNKLIRFSTMHVTIL